jgi:(R,R)-butanediol dehydrogenase/meso-butanediol dehydrogenase/diacetyl reductase
LDPLAADHGGFATHAVADARRLVPVAEAIDIRSAALIEPASVAVHAVRRSGLGIGDVVVVVGAGTVGLLTAEIARIGGAAHVVSIDTAVARRELACDLGSDAAFAAVDDSVRSWLDVHTGGLGADIVFVCVDTVEAISSGIGLVGSGGSIVAVGVGDRIDNLSITSLLVREADFRVSLGYSADDISRVQALMRQDRLRVRPLIQTPDVRGLANLAAAFAADQDRRPGPPKVLVRPNG